MNNTYRRAIIFLNGDRSTVAPVRSYIDKHSLLIGCDGGTDHILALGLKPHIIIGDFDSLSFTPPEPAITKPGSIKYIQYPTDKDLTDSELAINYAIEQGFQDIILTGALGTRLDHLLGNIFLLTKPAYSKVHITLIEGDQTMYVIRRTATIKGKVGDTISFMPVTGVAQVTSSSGLKYDLSQYKLSMHGNQGISNVLTHATATIKMKTGLLLVIHQT